ncbi:site-2 protease family protein [Campylobacter showae]|uniref:site-2 protease family protein n=1 Tax=Campylobacter showae TaxID=204 RepID=UPI00261F1ED9|nr:site-2 protease family protein [Campylobacter showae]
MNLDSIDFAQVAILVAVLVISVVGHEIAHGYAAFKFGDLTAKNLGRLSINPIKHVDPLGTIVVPALMYLSTGVTFGWAKPVPINLRTVLYNGGYKAAIIVALAGIAYNLALFALAFCLFKFIGFDGAVAEFVFMLAAVNLVLALFNLYPIPPLDGSKALEYLLRIFGLHGAANWLNSMQRYGFIALVIIVISPLKDYFFEPIRYAVAIMRMFL